MSVELFWVGLASLGVHGAVRPGIRARPGDRDRARPDIEVKRNGGRGDGPAPRACLADGARRATSDARRAAGAAKNSAHGLRHRPASGAPAEQTPTEERPLERPVAVHSAATEARHLPGGVQP